MDELTHHGILGMKWGVRRYQNKDGSLTPAGKKRYGTKANFEKVQNAKAKAKSDAKKAKIKANVDGELEKIQKKTKGKSSSSSAEKPISEMTDAELRKKIERIKLENELKSLTPTQTTKGQKFVKNVGDVVVPAVKDASKEALTKYLKKQLSNTLGVDEKSLETAEAAAKKASEKLKREADDSSNRRKIYENEKYFEEEKAKKNKKETEAKVDKDIEDKINETEKKNSEKQSKTEERKVYEGTVQGKGTSKYTEPKGETVDAQYRDVGKSYVQNVLGLGSSPNRLALEDPNKKK